MGFFKYQIKETFKEIGRHPANHLFSTGAVTLAFLLVGLVFLMSGFIGYIGEKWSSGATVVVYLKNNFPKTETQKLISDIKKLKGVKRAEYVSSEKSKKRLQSNLGEENSLISNLEADFFPTSVEVYVTGNFDLITDVKNRLYALKDISYGVKDVKTVYSWNRNVSHILDILTIVGMIISIIILFVAGYIIMSAAKLSIENKVEELKFLKLMGSDNSFVSFPVLFQGFLKGIVAFVLAVVLLYGISRFTYPVIELIFGENFVPIKTLPFFSAKHLLLGALIAGFTGITAGKIALSPLKTD